MVLGSTSSIADGPLLTAAEVGILLGVDKPAQVRRNSHAGRLPRPIQVTARCLRWRRDELLAWINAGSPLRQKWEDMRDA